MDKDCTNLDGLDVVVILIIFLKILGVITISWWWIIGPLLAILAICLIVGLIEL